MAWVVIAPICAPLSISSAKLPKKATPCATNNGEATQRGTSYPLRIVRVLRAKVPKAANPAEGGIGPGMRVSPECGNRVALLSRTTGHAR
jgi:hypothetical protein